MSIFEGSPAFKKGLRRGDVIARIEGRGRQGLDERAGRPQAQGPEGHDRRHLHQAPRLRPADRPGGRARRGQHHDRSRRVHDRRADRLREAAGFLGDVGPRSRRSAEKLKAKGMKRLVFDLRDNPGGAARPGHRLSQPVPAARRHDRLHARPRSERRPGVSRDARRATTPTCRWSCWSTATAPARRRS